MISKKQSHILLHICTIRTSSFQNYKGEIFINQNYLGSNISLPNSMARNIIKHSLDNNSEAEVNSFDFLVYVTLRQWARYSDLTSSVELKTSIGFKEDDWVCEMNGYLAKPEIVYNYMFLCHRNYKKAKCNDIKESLVKLIKAGYIYCYDTNSSSFFGSEEFSSLEEAAYNDITFYFTVPTGFYFVPEGNIRAIIKYCKDNNIHSIDYYILLYVVLEFNFKITRFKGQCYLSEQEVSYFANKKRLWTNVPEVLSCVGISKKHRVLKNDGGFATLHLFYKDKEVERVEENVSNQKLFSDMFTDTTDILLAKIIEQGLYKESAFSYNTQLVERGNELLELFENNKNFL